MSASKVVGLSLVAIGVALLVPSLFMHKWFLVPPGPFGGSGMGEMGLLGATEKGVTVSYSSIDGENSQVSTFILVGKIVFGLGALACVLAVVTAVRSLTGGSVLYATAVVACLSLAAAVAFTQVAPNMTSSASLGTSFYLYLTGAGFLLGGELTLPSSVSATARSNLRPIALAPTNANDDAPLEPSPPPSSVVVGPVRVTKVQPGCPTCRAPMEWNSKYEKYECRECGVYVEF